MERRLNVQAREFVSRTATALGVLLWLMAAGSVSCASAAGSRAGDPGATATGMDSLVQTLLVRAAQSAGSSSPLSGIRFAGVAWDAGDGLSAGTSALGLRIDGAVEGALVAQGAAAEAGSKGVGGRVLRGAFQVLKSGVKLTLSVVDSQSGGILAEVQSLLKPSSLAGIATEALLPPDHTNARLLAQLLQDTLGDTPAAFGIRVTTDRGENGAYFEGDRLHAVVEVDRDCYLRLYHISWSERALTLIFPNRSELNSFLPAGSRRQIPDDRNGAVFEVAKPYGVDAIVAVASTQPFADDAQVTAHLSGGSPGVPGSGSMPAAGGVVGAGPYLTQPGVSESQARGVFARGLVVHHQDPAGAGVAAGGFANAGTAAQIPPGTLPADPPAWSPAAALPVPAALARAVCYFTTLPRTSVTR